MDFQDQIVTVKKIGCRSSVSIRSDTGAATAEYAIATLAAVAFAGLLLAILKSDEVKQLLFNLIENALTPAG